MLVPYAFIKVNAGMGRASRRKQTKRPPKQRLAKSGPWGFDYGVSIRAAAVGSFNFSQKLSEADVIAIAYGSIYADEVNGTVPALTLVGRDELSLREAFKEFNTWAEASDGDAVELTVVFHTSNGYTVIIGPNSEKLVDRVFRYDAILEPLAFQASWVKPIDTLSDPLKEIRAFLENGIRPFILSAATYSGLTTPGAAMLDLVRPVRGIRNLLKFTIRFVDEGSERDKDWQRIARLSKSRKASSKPPTKTSRLPDPKEIFASRANRLKALFPVTLWRAEIRDDIRPIIEGAERLGLRRWQAQQALCNALLSREIGRREPHFMGIPESDWPDCLIDRLRKRYEIANGDSGAVGPIMVQEILRQALLDVGYLLNNYDVRTMPTELVSAQNALKKLGLLDNPPA